jgi:hypothetical protein
MGREINLQGWDTANIVTDDVLNAAIAGQGTSPKSFDNTDPGSGASITGVWGPWQKTSLRTGEMVSFMCPIVSGTGTEDSGKTVDLAKASLNIEIQLKTLDDLASAFIDKSAKTPAKTAPARILMVNDQSTPTNPAVTVISIVPASLRNSFQFLFEDWFNANIASFKQIFHAIMLDETAAKADFQWLKPTDISYAAATTTDGKTSVFAALCATDGDPIAKLPQQIDPAAVENMPAGCNCVLAISGEKFAEHILKPGAQSVLKGSQPADFDIIGDGLVVTNNKDLDWIGMTLDDGTVVTPRVPKGNFRISVVEDQIELEFTQMTFKHALLVGNDDFTLSFRQYLKIGLGKNANGEQVLVPDFAYQTVNGKKVPIYVDKPVITVTPDQQAVDFERTMGIVAIALSVLPLGCGIFKAGSWAVSNAPAAAAIVGRLTGLWSTGSAVFDIAIDGAEVAQLSEAAIDGSDNAAALAAFDAGTPVRAEFSTLVNRIATCSGVWAAIAGSLAAVV